MRIKLIPATVGLALLIGGISSANAGLIDRGNGLIYDDDLNITWLADANYAATQYVASSGAEGDADGLMTWSAATTWADDLVYEGYDDWRLFNADSSDTNCSDSFNPGGGFPTQNLGYECTANELGHLFYDELGVTPHNSINSSVDTDLNLFSNVQSFVYWSGTDYGLNTVAAWLFSTMGGNQGTSNKANESYAWAVRSGDVASATVPEPGTMLLLAAGMIGIAGVKRRRC